MENYKLLVELMHQFSSLKIWDYIDSRDIFQIRLASKDVFVSVLGNAGIEYGLIVYEGVSDLSLQMLAENDSAIVEQPDMPFHLSYIKVECRDGLIMGQYDTSGRIFDYGIEDECIAVKFNVGCPMRLVNEEECELLIELLMIMNKYHLHIKALDFERIDSKSTYSLKHANHRLYSKVIDFPAMQLPDFYFTNDIDEELLEEVSLLERKDEWGIGIFYSPAFVDEDENSYFPKLCIIYNKTKDQILDLLIPYKDEYEDFPQLLLETFLKIGYLPEYLNIANFETLSYFASLLDKLMLDGEVKMLEEFNDIYTGMSNELKEEIKNDELLVS